MVALLIALHLANTKLGRVSYTAPIVEVAHAEVDTAAKILDHRQEVWLSALEWCESSGKNDAINAEDLDGTPSYGAYQFKPGTFSGYVNKYGIEVEREKGDLYTFMNYSTQRKIVKRMMSDPEVRWEHEFPWCVKKLGRPPVK